MAKPTGPWAVLISGGLFLAVSQGVQADTNLTSREVNIAPPPCVLTRCPPLDVPSGNDRPTSRVDGMHYMRGVPYHTTSTSPANKQ